MGSMSLDSPACLCTCIHHSTLQWKNLSTNPHPCVLVQSSPNVCGFMASELHMHNRYHKDKN